MYHAFNNVILCLSGAVCSVRSVSKVADLEGSGMIFASMFAVTFLPSKQVCLVLFCVGCSVSDVERIWDDLCSLFRGHRPTQTAQQLALHGHHAVHSKPLTV